MSFIGILKKLWQWMVTPHIYGKKQTRPFRKMGHVTIVNADVSEARKIAEKVKRTIEVISE
jgi:5-(carboxyamino)imidazole ribonucleotide synthase